MFERTKTIVPKRGTVLSLAVQASLPVVERKERSQFRLLLEHFLERFFNNELAAVAGEAKGALILAACGVGLPGFIMALYLYPPYHDIRGPRPYWAQVSDHYCFAMFPLVSMGILTVFEWDFFFPDRLDLFVLASLPIAVRRMFLARIAAVSVFLSGFLFDSIALAALFLPVTTDPPRLGRFLAAHLSASLLSGLSGAAFFLALQGLLVAALGERLFRRIALPVQGLSVAVLCAIFLLSPTILGSLHALLRTGSPAVLCFPPFWFLGVYERVLQGPAAPPIFARLAAIGVSVALIATGLAMAVYPLAYWRRTRQIVEGPAAPLPTRGLRRWGSWRAALLVAMRRIDGAFFPAPEQRAIRQFLGQTLMRVQRYRIYLVMYGGLGAALMVAGALRIGNLHGRIHVSISRYGLRAAVPLAAMWTVAGLRTALLSPAETSGRWIFRVIQGRPGLEQFAAVRRWVQGMGVLVGLGTAVLVEVAAGSEGLSWRFAATQALVAIGLSLLLSDLLFFRVRSIPFTGARPAEATRLVFVLILYLGFFPVLLALTMDLEPLLQSSAIAMAAAGLAIAAAHFAMLRMYGRMVAREAGWIDLEDDEDEFPQRLGLRY